MNTFSAILRSSKAGQLGGKVMPVSARSRSSEPGYRIVPGLGSPHGNVQESFTAVPMISPVSRLTPEGMSSCGSFVAVVVEVDGLR
jgi:hypothetical protein